VLGSSAEAEDAREKRHASSQPAEHAGTRSQPEDVGGRAPA
jgi:hypothetical protein